MTVMLIVSAPRVVSPPTSSMPCMSAMRKKPRAKAVSQASFSSGSAIASVAQRGVAPIAARSDRFTASDLWPMPAGLSCGEKWRPSSSMSDDTASCMPGVGASSAQSSPTPSTAPGVARVKWRAMRSNST